MGNLLIDLVLGPENVNLETPKNKNATRFTADSQPGQIVWNSSAFSVTSAVNRFFGQRLTTND